MDGDGMDSLASRLSVAAWTALPYGGVKQSGIGRRAGIDGVREYMQIQTLTTFEQ
jgi:acyl-CoA reductase-like NAD-dependent aldehyde dehydrogenase